MTSFRATFGLTRSIGGWEEGERGERKKRKRQPGRTGAEQRREWQLNEQREEINTDVEEGEENIDVEEREKDLEREWGSNLRRQRLASPTAQVLVAQSERLTPGQSGWLGAAAVGSIPTLALDLSLFPPFLRRR